MAETDDTNGPPNWWPWQVNASVADATVPFSFHLLLEIAEAAGIRSDVVLGDRDNLTPAQIEARLDDVLTRLLAILRRERAQEEDP